MLSWFFPLVRPPSKFAALRFPNSCFSFPQCRDVRFGFGEIETAVFDFRERSASMPFLVISDVMLKPDDSI